VSATGGSGSGGAFLQRTALIGALGGNVAHDLPADGGLGDEREDAHSRAAAGTRDLVALRDAANQLHSGLVAFGSSSRPRHVL